MAVVRLALVALVACRASEAGPNSGLSAPPGWKPLPTLASAASDAAKSGGFTVDGVEAWGETARGCYGAWMSLGTRPASPAQLAKEILAGMDAESIGVFGFKTPAANTTDDAMSFGFEKRPYRGELRARLSKDGHITALACFYNEREPEACAAACGQLFGGFR